MNRFIILLSLFFIDQFCFSQQKVESPAEIYGELFKDVQLSKIFPDSKMFVDCIPKKDPKEILKDYLEIKKNPAIRFSLELFIKENFELPVPPPTINYIQKEKDIAVYIKNLWSTLRHETDKKIEGSSLVPLPFPYIVPGGRFREVYYWDSYFTMLGLKQSGEAELIENMTRNFAYLIETFGHIPNGNRSYYKSRSQPPFFAAMVQLLASIRGDNIYISFLPALEKEYNFWMDGADRLKTGQAFRRVVKLKDGSVLNRYWDDNDGPREESYKEDIAIADKSGRNKTEVYKNIRAAAESGFDFGSRWFADGKNITTIQTTNLVPVDLNALLYNLEITISKANLIARKDSIASEFRKKANRRQIAVDKYCWNAKLNFYTDYNFRSQKISNIISPAGIYPFCFFESKLDYLSLLARRVAKTINTKLLKPGGLAASDTNTTQQWDLPNGWAPLQWMTIWGLDRCGQKELAKDIAVRWIKLNNDVFQRTGKLMEKYNVVDLNLEGGGGEYEGQDGFGWTNGVLLALIAKYGKPGS